MLPWRRGCGEKPLCIVTKATSSRLAGRERTGWEGGGPERRKREERGGRPRRGRGRGSEKEKRGMTSRGRRRWRRGGNLSPGFIIRSISALFTPAGSQLRGRIYSFL